MGRSTLERMSIGDLIASAFDLAAQRSSNPEEVSRLATRAVMRALRSARLTPLFKAAGPASSDRDSAER